MMKRLLLVALAVVLAVFAGAWLLRMWAEARNPRKPLPGGGTARVYAVTHEEGSHHIELPRQPLTERLRAAMNVNERSLESFLEELADVRSSGRAAGYGGPTLMLWLQTEGRANPPNIAKVELVLDDGQVARGHSERSGSAGDFQYLSASFPLVPHRQKKLRFRLEMDGGTLEFVAANPAYLKKLGVWQPQPLPQTQRVGEVEVTLRDLRWVPSISDWPGENPCVVEPSWLTRVQGVQNAEALSEEVQILDAGGNVKMDLGILSEPAWKVRATFTRTRRYPFHDPEVRWIAKVEPRPAESIAPQSYELVPLDADTVQQGVKLIGFFGAGQFGFSAAGEVRSMPGARSDQVAKPAISWVYEGQLMLLALPHPALLVYERKHENLTLCQDEARAVLDPVWQSDRIAHRRITLYEVPNAAVRFGTAAPSPVTFEFLVRPPKMPAEQARSGDR